MDCEYKPASPAGSTKMNKPANPPRTVLTTVLLVSTVFFLATLVYFTGDTVSKCSSTVNVFIIAEEEAAPHRVYRHEEEGPHIIHTVHRREEETPHRANTGNRHRNKNVHHSRQNDNQCSLPSTADRFDCHPGPGVFKESCEAQGCCWVPADTATDRQRPDYEGVVHLEQNLKGVDRYINVPYCFYPSNYQGYVMADKVDTEFGSVANVTRSSSSPWPNDVMVLRLEVYEETETRLHFKLVDARRSRYEVPLKTPVITKKAPSTQYKVDFTQSPFSLKVTRKSTGAVLFDSGLAGAPLIYADQFLQISTRVPSGLIYGIGEERAPLAKKFSSWRQISLWARDVPPTVGNNLYGTHPFYMSLEEDGSAHGVFLLNSNAMDIIMQPTPALTFRTIGGILDFYVLTGPSPDMVAQQYASVVGLSVMPPYWSLGFHLCRWNYSSSGQLSDVVARMRNARMPYDVQWTDIDYMDNYLDWTYDTEKFHGLPDIVQDLHNHHQRYVPIIDPGISISHPGQYPPYDDGLKRGIFIKNATGQPIVGKVWPGLTVFPDFTHPDAAAWWTACAYSFYKQVPFDGIWIDMNEPSSEYFGSTFGCTDSSLDKPPYTPGILDESLASRTLCPSALQYLSSHYNLHSLYGYAESVATKIALEAIQGNNRSFIISRSTFSGTGHHSGHWTGDNSATWDDLYFSIPGILNFQMFGVSLVGADICGFMGSTTAELCTRWMQLGAFYPFMRNHNTIGAPDQDPAVFDKDSQDRMRSALELRYSLLPTLYTLFYHSHTNGTAPLRPLFHQYPTDKNTYEIDRQFMWGDALLITPVLTQGAVSVSAYIPDDVWYDYYTGVRLSARGQHIQLDAPIDKINLHIRGGSVIVVQDPEVTTYAARYNGFSLVVAISDKVEASGDLYWDDGLSRDSMTSGAYNLVKFNAKQGVVGGRLVGSVVHSGYASENGMSVSAVRVLGVTSSPSTVTVNSHTAVFNYTQHNQVLHIDNLESVDLTTSLTVEWH